MFFQLLFFIAVALAGFINDTFLSDGSGSPVAQFTLGTPPQKYRATLGTGSSVPMFVVDFNQDVFAGYNYDGHKSSSLEETDDTATVVYGSGTYTGNWSSDVATWGSNTFNITFIDSDTDNAPIVGVSPIYNESNIMNQLEKLGVIDQKVFSIYYDNLLELTGSYVIGGIDRSKFIGDLVPVGFDYIQVNNYTLSDSNSTNFVKYTQDINLLFDTGGVFAMIPDNIAENIYRKYGDGRTVDCSVIKRAKPVITAVIGGVYPLTIRLEDYIGSCDSSTQLTQITSFSPDTPQDVTGPSFFKNAYVVWDYENKQVLLAKRNPNPGSPDLHLLDTQK